MGLQQVEKSTFLMTLGACAFFVWVGEVFIWEFAMIFKPVLLEMGASHFAYVIF